ncbi:hypothetical protein ON010_g3617 [Phytophthora cinnamomi]|nr:hypothetical protein ON010_g3617 [Phytophthora cinnamomi]
MVQWMTVAQKFELIQKHRQNPSLSTRKLALWAHEAFNLPTGPTAATVSRVLKAADDIEDKQRHGVTRKGHGVSCPELDVALKAYVDQCGARDPPGDPQRADAHAVGRMAHELHAAPQHGAAAALHANRRGGRRRRDPGGAPGGHAGAGARGSACAEALELAATCPHPDATGACDGRPRSRSRAPCRSTGVAFVNHYIREGWDVIAACPNLNACAELKEAAPWKLVEMDPGSKLSVDNTALQLKDVPIDLVVNNARLFKKGYMHSTTPEDCVKMYEVNALGPFIVSRALLQNLRLAVRDRGMAFVANISSRVGSISENVTGGSYGFRASMSALNMFTKSLVADLLPHKIGCLLIHSGIDDKPEVPHASADVQPEESVAGMAQVIARSRLGEPLQLRHFGNGDGIVW